jgi:glycerol-3-phosphate acyltransferase PlsY
MELNFWLLLPVLIFSYLLGAIPFGLLLTKYAGLGDIRQIGSGNIGATNVLRTGRKGLAAATLVLDAAKGWLAVFLSTALLLPPVFNDQSGMVMALAALAVVIGHMFPVYLRFKGGKGVATALGAILAIQPLLALILVILWLGVAFAFQYSSLAALVACAMALPLGYFVFDIKGGALGLMGALVALVALRHWQNVFRLWRGVEGKIQLSSKPASAGEARGES